MENRGPLRAFSHFSWCPSGKVLEYFIGTCCTTEAASGYLFVMAGVSDFSEVSFCVQYFRNPGTGYNRPPSSFRISDCFNYLFNLVVSLLISGFINRR
jgi:hypothetical protein